MSEIDETYLKSLWRPAAGWICVLALLYQFVLRPLLILFLILNNITIDFNIISLDEASLMTLLFGMLGLGLYRTTEKLKGVN